RNLTSLKKNVANLMALTEEEMQGSRDNFWTKTARINADLLVYLLNLLGGKVRTFDENVQIELVTRYADSWKQFGSARELNSVIEQYSFLAAVLRKPKYDATRKTLEQIISALKAVSQGEDLDTQLTAKEINTKKG
ncbi:MAG TPA: hypothetical protein VMJ90_07495, partial [Anaerolineales bacterium]|nr:hypothetical protein [Anaerolineales bacterium]